MKRHLIVALIGAGFGAMALACGSAAPPPQNTTADRHSAKHPELRAIAQRTAGAANSPDDMASAAPDQQSNSEATSPAPSDNATEAFQPAATARKSRVDLMTARETAYIIDYSHSGALDVAKSSCTVKSEAPAREETEEEAEERNAQRDKQFNDCMKKARDKFVADVLRFRRDGLGNIQFVVYRRSGSALTEINVTNVELDESSTDLVRVKVKGTVAGQRPILRDRDQFDVKIPSGYSIELEDPQYGKLLYDEKVGLVAN